MIKFSSYTGDKINSEPKIELSKEVLELEGLKQSILDLIEKTLVVRNIGPVYKHAMVVSQIDGKEMFVEALLDFLSEKENKKAITYLESLKESNHDWKSIDDKIGQIQNENKILKFLGENSSHIEQIKVFLDKNALLEDFDDLLEKQIQKITEAEVAFIRSEIATYMLENANFNKYPKGRLRSIANKFAFRAKQLKEA